MMAWPRVPPIKEIIFTITFFILTIDDFLILMTLRGFASLFCQGISGGSGDPDEQGIPMNCNRCGGMMTYERFYGPHEQFLGWRCVYCGEIVDEVILENREWFGKGVIAENKRRKSFSTEQ